MPTLNKHDTQILFRRGAEANITATATKNTSSAGEPHWTTDEDNLYVSPGVAQSLQLIGGASTWDANGDLLLNVYTDATRPAAGTAGRVIFNSDDGQLNIDDGTNWTLPDGTTT
jgi:hypothetical protein